ncbi:NuoI/complex I 23 kDa subunit family protein [Dehalococcoides mccartyi]|uniref:NADH:quinone oxidoreductase subunit 1 (Chain I) n=1 Tax=Dehalococcoides mccartyi (strain VS) TaxID=311424 RepID=D2BHX9_DEHMV|nr:NADH-quinone oxidoreductase subunit I [Dehalococcoides mccartyi]ACZ61929.1 NADH:quinone oxidoreductase subunit 1 (chain I) [Dehalococcoides mccartyi VS]
MSVLSNTGGGILKGMRLTFKHLFRPWITAQYPEEKLTMSKRIRGTQVIWVKETCIACLACARACPVKAINMEVSRGEDRKLKVDHMSIDFGLCVFCGLCVESCPTKNAIYMGYGYETTTYRCTNIAKAEGQSRSECRCRELILTGDELAPSATRILSGYDRPEAAEKLAEQTLLINKKGYFER